MVQTRGFGFAMVVAALGAGALSGCSSGSTEAPLADAGHRDVVVTADTGLPRKDAGQPCTPNAQQCATPKIAEVCAADGSGWVSTPCGEGQSCTGGVCGGDAGSGCTPNAKECVSPTVARVCPADGSAWLGVACATGETCTGGVCVAGDAGTACPASKQECVSATLSRVCPADGSGWLAVPCQAGEACVAGTCTFVADAPCAPGTGGCLTATTGLLCNAAGTMYEQVTCPAKTTCNGGNCYGAVLVGSSQCESLTTLATSTDGFTYTTSSCPSGTFCVATSTSTAACVAGNCTPDTSGNNCDTVCGNKVDSTADQTTYTSTCVATPNGYEWVAVECPSPATCNPTGGTCGYGIAAPACTSACTPGATRCAPDGSGVQTCGTDGTWGAGVACDPLKGYVCQNLASTGMGVCGDLVCLQPGATGTCTPGGLFQACTASYTLEPAASATACPTGESCAITPGTPIAGAYQPGACTQACTPGTTECSGNGIAKCTSAGVWGAPSACGGGTSCQQYTSAGGAIAAVCGTCVPGTHRCTSASGDAGGTADIETCDDSGKWGAAAACQVGTCQSTGTDFGCVTECIPNAEVCAPGGTGTGTCSATGTLPAHYTACTSGTTCRTDSNNNAIGCVQCLGPNHGLPADTECTTTTAGVPGSAAIDVCGAQDTWQKPSKCTGGTSCSIGNVPACDTFAEGGLSGPGIPPSELVTQSNIAAFIPGGGCVSIPYDYSTPAACGSTPDCCTGFCGTTLGPVCQ